MDTDIDELVRKLVRLEDEIEQKLDAERDRLAFRIERGKAVFEERALARHRRLRVGLVRFLRHSPLAVALLAPAVYALIVPFLLLDLGVAIYQTICFPARRIARVRRADYIMLDRHRLAYLNGIEKLNCAYCSYANGVLAHAREVASRTEQYWCPIRHALRIKAPHRRYGRFVAYGDGEGFRARLDALRAEVRRSPD
jgi:hypothetical protein